MNIPNLIVFKLPLNLEIVSEFKTYVKDRTNQRHTFDWKAIITYIINKHLTKYWSECVVNSIFHFHHNATDVKIVNGCRKVEQTYKFLQYFPIFPHVDLALFVNTLP